MNKDQKYEKFTIAPLVNSLYMKLPRRGILCLTLREVQNPEKLRSLEVDLIYLTDVIFQPFFPTLRRSCTRMWRCWFCSICDIAVWGDGLCVLLNSSFIWRRVVGANFNFRWIPEVVVGWLCKSMSWMISFYTIKTARTFCRRCCWVRVYKEWFAYGSSRV